MDQAGPGPINNPFDAIAAWRQHCRRLKRSEARDVGTSILVRLAQADWPDSIEIAFNDLDDCPHMDRRAFQYAAEMMVASGIWSVRLQPGRPSHWTCHYDVLLAPVAAEAAPVDVAAPKRVAQQKPAAVQQPTPPAQPPAEPVKQIAQPPQQPAGPAPAKPDDPMARAFAPGGAGWGQRSQNDPPGATVGVTDEQRAIEASPMWAACERWIKESEHLTAEFWTPAARKGYLDLLAPKPIPFAYAQMESELLLEALKRTKPGMPPAYTQGILRRLRDAETYTMAALKAQNGPQREEVQKGRDSAPPDDGAQNLSAEISARRARRQRSIAAAKGAGEGAGMTADTRVH